MPFMFWHDIQDHSTYFSLVEVKDRHSDGCAKESSCLYSKSVKTDAVSYISEEFSDETVELNDFQMLLKDYALSGQCYLTVPPKFIKLVDNMIMSFSGRAYLTGAREKEVLKKVEKIQSALHFYLAMINKTNVCRRGSNITPVLVSKQSFGLDYAAT